MEDTNKLLLKLTSEIVTSYVSGNEILRDEIPNLIKSVYGSLASAGEPKEEPAVELVPAVPIKRSVFPDYIVCLEDGKKLKLLKRHLKTAYNMTPEQYRERWGLPSSYPMVAPNYAEHRSSLAREIGLGRKISAHTEDAEPAVEVQPETVEGVEVKKIPPARRGRKPKAE